MRGPLFALLSGYGILLATPAEAVLQVGTAVVDVSPQKYPVLVNGSMTSRLAEKLKTKVNARAMVFSDGKTELALVVVDSCMIGRELLDGAKALAAAQTSIPAERMLISATHAHSAPSAMGCLGTEMDETYAPYLKQKLADAIITAHQHLKPARIGFARVNAAEFTAVRQWIRRPDRVVEDPFGNMTVRANMHAGKKPEEAVGEAGPEDPDLCLISLQSPEGKPLAVLGNFSMHYFMDEPISADYFGLFSEGLKTKLGQEGFVAAMSHGCSGDIWRADYMQPGSWSQTTTLDEYAAAMVELAAKALQGLKHEDVVDIAMAEQRLALAYRVADKQRLEWSQRVVAGLAGKLPKTLPEIYAREQLFLAEKKETQVVVQALRLGDIGIATTPNETYAVTGLKIKAASPLKKCVVIELANGGDGYIPPPEQHAFGGYNTWAARSAGLEVQAEPKIAQTAIHLLEQVSGQPRRSWELPEGPSAKLLREMKPYAWWKLDEFHGPLAADASGHARTAVMEPGMTYALQGPAGYTAAEASRAVQLVSGRLWVDLSGVGSQHTLVAWVRNGMPTDARETTGWIYSRDTDHALTANGVHVGLAGRGQHEGRLLCQLGDKVVAYGKTALPRWQWQHVAVVHAGAELRVYLNGQLEVSAQVSGAVPTACYLGGRSDRTNYLEGRLDEVAVFDSALTAEDLARLSQTPLH
jgi:hypothetical protein